MTTTTTMDLQTPASSSGRLIRTSAFCRRRRRPRTDSSSPAQQQSPNTVTCRAGLLEAAGSSGGWQSNPIPSPTTTTTTDPQHQFHHPASSSSTAAAAAADVTRLDRLLREETSPTVYYSSYCTSGCGRGEQCIVDRFESILTSIAATATAIPGGRSRTSTTGSNILRSGLVLVSLVSELDPHPQNTTAATGTDWNEGEDSGSCGSRGNESNPENAPNNGSSNNNTQNTRSVIMRLQPWTGGEALIRCWGECDDDNNNITKRVGITLVNSVPHHQHHSGCCSCTPPRIWISWFTAINLGWMPSGPDPLSSSVDISVAASSSSTNTNSSIHIAEAKTVILSLVGRPTTPRLGDRRPVATTTWPLPPLHTLVQPGTLIQVPVVQQQQYGTQDGCSPFNANISSSNNNRAINGHFYYKVVEVNGNTNMKEDTLDNRNPCDHDDDDNSECAWLSKGRTRFHFKNDTPHGVTSLASAVPLLPPRLEASLCFGSNVFWPPHPDVPRLVRLWRRSYHCDSYSTPPKTTTILCHSESSMPTVSHSSVFSPSDCIWHIQGIDEDHHVELSIKTAAAQLGRQCIVVAGLAAHAALYNSKHGDDDQDASVYTVTTGGWVDKLKGLQIALDEAMSNAPSILFLSDICLDLSQHDLTARTQEESRIWSVLTDTLGQTSTSSLFECKSRPLPLQVPAVLVVLNTRSPLPATTFKERLVFESIRASLPDDNYTAFLWQSFDGVDEYAYLMGAMDDKFKKIRDIPMNQVQELMKDRPAREIIELRDELWYGITATCENAAILEQMENLCLKHDEARRRSAGRCQIPSTRWEDVGGLATVRREILDAIELPLKYPKMFSAADGRRSGMLLYGPPGTGKTLVAKAVATECGLPFVSIKGPELLGSYVGESEAQVRDTFDHARKLAGQNHPSACILFFDELDSLAPRRGDQAMGGNVMDRVVATLLAELDKDPGDNAFVFCMAATNRPDLLDPALLRPGRLDRLVYLGVSHLDHATILATQLRKLRLDGDVMEVASSLAALLPPTLTGADLSTIASGGLLRATERLCQRAETELIALLQNRHSGDNNVPMLTVDDVLSSWDDQQLEPVVLMEDLVDAARQIVPSVTASELENYRRLGETFSMIE